MRHQLPYFLPYQQRWIQDNAPIAIGEKARRIGWTYASSFRAVYRRLTLGTDLFHTSADLTAAREFIEYCARWSRVFDTVASDMGEQIIDEQDGMRAFVLRFTNGARIVAGSSNPKFFRSKGGDADADEFAFHQRPRELLKAMQPTSLVWGHQLRLWSTHNGEGSYFATLVDEAKNAPSQKRSIHTVTLLDAVDQGLVERIRGLGAPDEHARRGFIEELRASCPDEDAWNEEYLCRPSTEGSSLLEYRLIEACEVDALPTTPATSLFAGYDVGRKKDLSVLWVLEQLGNVFWTREVRTFEDVPFSAQEAMLDALLANRLVRRLCIDSSGLGAMLAERLVRKYPARVEAVTFTSASKSELALPLVRLFQDNLIRIPKDDAIRDDLHAVRRIHTASHNVRYDASRSDTRGHADRFWALALAYHATDDARGRMPLQTAPKLPSGWL